MPQSYSVPHILARRELDSRTCFSLQRHFRVTKSFIERLSLEKELEGHSGCVNCLEWDEGGRLLASGSDDFLIIIWDPFSYKPINKIETGHHGNIFSVKFMPATNNETIVTGAGDCEVRVHNLLNEKVIKVCTCHGGRVKRLATAPSVVNVFWSAGEDGIIRQYDLRMPHVCDLNEPSILVDLRTHSGEFIEAKCLSVNQMKPELLAVGANDPYVRLYDRRMIKLVKGPRTTNSTTEDNLAPGCVQYFVPGHIAGKLKMTERQLHSYSATYVTFDPNGNYLLANLGREQIYLYDINSATASLLVRRHNADRELNNPLKGYCQGFPDNVLPVNNNIQPKLPVRINALKLTGNELFKKACYAKSIRLYNEAIAEYPYSSVFYSNRAAAYMKREWSGDTYAALRDCISSLEYDPSNAKAYFRLIRCLYILEWYEESKLTLELFKQLFPSDGKLVTCRALEHDIDAKLSTNKPPAKSDVQAVTSQEYEWRENANDYLLRFYDHCNTMTDIKEANFFGSDGNYIVAGSDEGSIFIWDRKNTNNVRILKGDSSIVNCVQPHPTSCLLATSGIEARVRLWSPRKEEEDDQKDVLQEIDQIAEINQRRMQSDPFDIVLMNMSLPTSEPMNAQDFVSTYGCRTS